MPGFQAGGGYSPSLSQPAPCGPSAARQCRIPIVRGVWCIFDNTTLGAATRNALDLSSRLGAYPSQA